MWKRFCHIWNPLVGLLKFAIAADMRGVFYDALIMIEIAGVVSSVRCQFPLHRKTPQATRRNLKTRL
ncbi:hypothetical protein THS27_13520 [Thalassospira sp. MCCC 1A01428]|nr:hypothetical protein THS27_13520 [Thalassospira sp. MCCC 1A01428]